MRASTDREPAKWPLVRLAALCVLLLTSSCAKHASRRPDVILIVVDTLRADRLSCYGYPRPTSPRIDELAAQGALFLDCTSQSSWTSPSMVSMLQSRYLTTYRDELDPGLPCIADSFDKAGYRTVGLSANLLLKALHGYARGFDHYDARRANREPEATHSKPRTFEQLCDDLWQPLDEALRPDESGSRPPLFLYLQPFDPHFPYFEHPELEAELPAAATPEPESMSWRIEQLELHGHPRDPKDPTGERALRYIQTQRGLYDQEVRYTDGWIARLLERLKSLGVLEHAVVALVSDHGEGLWDHVADKPLAELSTSPAMTFFYQQHGAQLYQEAIHTPFILWGTGVPKNVRVARPVENVDLYPTLMELADLPVPAGLHGQSLVGLMRGDPSVYARPHVYSSVLLGECVRDAVSGLKLIEPSETARKNGVDTRLYDLPANPRERANLAPTRATDASALQAVLAAWRASHPTETTLGRERTEEEIELLNDLGYTAEQLGR